MQKFLNDKYIELPDCENAWLHKDNALKKNFYEHHHGFYKFEVLAKKIRLEILDI